MILGLVIVSNALPSLASLLFYIISYAFMNLGVFACVIAFNTMTGRDEIEAYSGLVQKRPLLVFAFAVFLLSLAGIPITSGFFAKFFLFQALASQRPELLYLVVFALLNSTVSLYYYLKLLKVMVVNEPSDVVKAIDTNGQDNRSISLSLATGVCCVVTLFMGIYAMPFTSEGEGIHKTSKPDHSVYATCFIVAQQLVLERMNLISSMPANNVLPQVGQPQASVKTQ